MTNKISIDRLVERIGKSNTVKESIESFLTQYGRNTPVTKSAEAEDKWNAAWKTSSDYLNKGVQRMFSTDLTKATKLGNATAAPDLSNEAIVKAVFASILSSRVIIPMFARESAQGVSESVITSYKPPVEREHHVSIAHGAYKFIVEDTVPDPQSSNIKTLVRAPGKYDKLYIDRNNFEVYTIFRNGLLIAPTKSVNFGKLLQSGRLNTTAGNSSMAVRKMIEYSSKLVAPVTSTVLQTVEQSLRQHISDDTWQFVMGSDSIKSVLIDCITIGVLDAVNINQEAGVRPWPAAEALRTTMFDGAMRTLYQSEAPKEWPPEIQVFRDKILSGVSQLIPLYHSRPGLSQDIQQAVKLAKNIDFSKVFASSSTLVHQMLGIINHGLSGSGLGEHLTQEIIGKLDQGWDSTYIPKLDMDWFSAFGSPITGGVGHKFTKLDIALNGTKSSPSDPDMAKYGFVLAYFTADENYAIKLQYSPHYFKGARNSTSFDPTRHKSSVTPGITRGAAQYITHLAQEEKAKAGDNSPVTAEEYLEAAKRLETGRASSSYRGAKEGGLFKAMVNTFYKDGEFVIPKDSTAILMITTPTLIHKSTLTDTIKIPRGLKTAPQELVTNFMKTGKGLPLTETLVPISTYVRETLEPAFLGADPTEAGMEGGVASVRDWIVNVRNYVLQCLISGLWTTDEITNVFNDPKLNATSLAYTRTNSANTAQKFWTPYALFNAFSWPVTKEDSAARGNITTGLIDSTLFNNINDISHYHNNAIYAAEGVIHGITD